MVHDKPLSKLTLRSGKPSRDDYLRLPRTPVILILDNLKVAYNVGTILRLAEAVMAEKVYLCGSTIVPPNSKIKTASRGAERWVPWEYIPQTLDAVTHVKGQGYQIIAVEISETSKPYTELNFQNVPCAFVLGREYDGVSPNVLSASDEVVHLPMLGMANSINVACAAAVLVYRWLGVQTEVPLPRREEGAPER